ncbi:hypothetical protein BH18ACI5_BH18ACI5_25150 [soil metagenome]
MKPVLLAAAGAVVLGMSLAGAGQTSPAGQVERPFVSAGKVRMDLASGAYIIRGGSVPSIRVRWDTRDPADMPRVTADLVVSGDTATLTTRGPHTNFHMQIDVPSRTDLGIDMGAGDISIRAVEGNKMLDMWAGDVSIEVGDASSYRLVDATVRAGDISAQPFGRNTGGLFRSLHWTGNGNYTLLVKLAAGDLKLVK